MADAPGKGLAVSLRIICIRRAALTCSVRAAWQGKAQSALGLHVTAKGRKAGLAPERKEKQPRDRIEEESGDQQRDVADDGGRPRSAGMLHLEQQEEPQGPEQGETGHDPAGRSDHSSGASVPQGLPVFRKPAHR